MNMIAVDRATKISLAKGSKVQHFYPFQLTTRGRQETRIPFYILTRWKSKRNWRTQSQLARRNFTLPRSRLGWPSNCTQRPWLLRATRYAKLSYSSIDRQTSVKQRKCWDWNNCDKSVANMALHRCSEYQHGGATTCWNHKLALVGIIANQILYLCRSWKRREFD